jgi:hypothetical protein
VRPVTGHADLRSAAVWPGPVGFDSGSG